MTKFYNSWKDVPSSEWRWPSFSPKEIACRGTGNVLIDPDALDKLQALRDRIGKPMIVNSAYRSPQHNRRVGGAKNSLHMEGVAFDVLMSNHDPHKYEQAARAVGFTGFGYYPKSGFMHVDTGPARSWGTPWPKSTREFEREVPRVPEKITEDKEAGAAVGAGASGSLAGAIEHVPVVTKLFGDLAPVAQTIAICAAAVFIGYIIWRKVK